MAGTKDPNSLGIFSIKQIRQVLSFFNILAYWNWNTIWRNWKNKNGKNKTLMQKWITYTILNNTDGSTGSIRNQNKNFKDQERGGLNILVPTFYTSSPFSPPLTLGFFAIFLESRKYHGKVRFCRLSIYLRSLRAVKKNCKRTVHKNKLSFI